MIMAAASVDDMYVIVAHTVILGAYAGRQVNVASQIAGIPIALLLGMAAGIAVGIVLYRMLRPV